MEINWSRIVSVEIIVSLVAMLLVFYGGYSVLADDQVELEEQVKKVIETQEEFKKEAADIKVDVEVIKTEQRYISEDVKEIRRLLENTYNNPNN